MRYFFLFILLSGIYSSVFSQTKTNLHIVTSARNHLPSFPNFHFQVNGQSYKLRAGKCLELTLNTDSIHIKVEDKRWVKNETDELHIAAEKDVFVWVKLIWTGNFREPRFGAEIICESCYDEIKEKCKY